MAHFASEKKVRKFSTSEQIEKSWREHLSKEGHSGVRFTWGPARCHDCGIEWVLVTKEDVKS